MGISSLVKSVRGKLSRNNKSQPTTAEFVDLGRSGGGGNGIGIKALALHPDAAELLKNYYGIDLAQIPKMSPEEMGELVDFMRQSEWMDAHLDTLKAHFEKYINRQVSFNQFVAEITKAGLKGAETIDKAGLDTYLAVKGYTQNSKKLGHKAGNEERRLASDLENYIQGEDYSLEASFKAMALKLSAKKKEIDSRPDKVAAQQKIQQEIKAESERIGNLIKYGTKGAAAMVGGSTTSEVHSTTVHNPSGGGGGGGGNIWTGLKNFFGGR